MAFHKSSIVDLELNTGNICRWNERYCIGKGDAGANRFGVRVFRDGVAESLSGASCKGIFTNANGTKISLTSNGTVSVNEAYLTLPGSCYEVAGNFSLSIRLEGGNVTGTVRIVEGTVSII